jgi:ABC-2 type transport system ATP-binding protein
MSLIPLLQTEALSKDYGRFHALDAVSLAVHPGEVVGLLGPNGSGKSTALRLMLGFIRPTAGRATIAGHDCWHDSVNVRRHVAYLPGELRLYETMTGRQIIAFLGKLRGRAPDPATVDALARRFDIDLSRPLVQMSSGMKRKVALMTVLLPQVPLVILDEPTNTLDPTMRDELLGQLADVRKRGQTVLFSSHVLAEVERVCDRVAILQKGKLVHLQAMDELREARRVTARFGRPPERWPDLPGMGTVTESDGAATLDYRGPLAPLLDWLGRQAVADLRVEPLGLGPIYHRYHGATA